MTDEQQHPITKESILKSLPLVLSSLSLGGAVFISYTNIQVQLATLNARLISIENQIIMRERAYERLEERVTTHIINARNGTNGKENKQ